MGTDLSRPRLKSSMIMLNAKSKSNLFLSTKKQFVILSISDILTVKSIVFSSHGLLLELSLLILWIMHGSL